MPIISVKLHVEVISGKCSGTCIASGLPHIGMHLTYQSVCIKYKQLYQTRNSEKIYFHINAQYFVAWKKVMS